MSGSNPMKRRDFIKTTGVAGIGLTAAVYSRTLNAARNAGRLPNFVILLADDLGYSDVGVYGARGWTTPNLDRLAGEGLIFTDFHVSQPVCSASRASLLTGCYANRIGIHGALDHMARHGISGREKTIAEIVKQKDYVTAIFGKWHLGHHPRFLPTRHGFDEYFGLPYSNDMWPNHPTSGKNYPPLPLVEGDKTIATNPDQSQLTTWYTERALKFIQRNRAWPFLLIVAYAMPHVPLSVSAKFNSKSEQGLYGDVVMELDWSASQILDALKRFGLEDETLVIFASDNGPWLSYGNHAGSARPLREGKGTVWEGGIRVPCLMRWPGKIPQGRKCSEPLMTMDFLPTIASLAGAKLPEHTIDGKNIWPLLSGEPQAKNPHEVLYFYYRTNELQALRAGKWKMVFPHTYDSLTGKPGQDGRPSGYSRVKCGLELYDLENDVGERENVVDRHPDIAKKLQALAELARQDLGDSLTNRKGQNVREPERID